MLSRIAVGILTFWPSGSSSRKEVCYIVLYAFSRELQWLYSTRTFDRVWEPVRSKLHIYPRNQFVAPSFDRYRTALRVDWHGSRTPGSGLIYDLGSHLIDQALVLFGKPEKITGFLQNITKLGDVEDNVRILFHASWCCILYMHSSPYSFIMPRQPRDQLQLLPFWGVISNLSGNINSVTVLKASKAPISRMESIFRRINSKPDKLRLLTLHLVSSRKKLMVLWRCCRRTRR